MHGWTRRPAARAAALLFPLLLAASAGCGDEGRTISTSEETRGVPPASRDPATPSAPPAAGEERDRPSVAWTYPIGIPGQALGDGFFVRHGFAVENTWFKPGWWHTGEDWYARKNDTAGARVYAAAEGEVVYAGADYPGRVVIVEHAAGLFSMYGHLETKSSVGMGEHVERGDLIGTVGRRHDGVPNHLHFEVRTFLTAREVNGSAPRYAYRCGVDCPPGPGYWPISAPELPGALGWRNPTHVIARRGFESGGQEDTLGDVVVASRPASASATLWSTLTADGFPKERLGKLELRPGERFPLLEVRTGPVDPEFTGAQGYELWYRLRLSDGGSGWTRAAVASGLETGGGGRPSAVVFNLLPAVPAP